MVQDVTDFGAVGDGTTDDTQAIRDAANAAGQGGTVYFPAGTYLVGENSRVPFRYPSGGGWDGVTWEGEAHDTVELKMAGGQSSDFFMFRGQSSAGSIVDATFKQLDINMNKQNQPASEVSHAILVNQGSGTLKMRDCIVRNSNAGGIKVHGDDIKLDIEYCQFSDLGRGDNSINGHAINPNFTSPNSCDVSWTLFENTIASDIDVGDDHDEDYVTCKVNRCYSEGSPVFVKLDPANAKTTISNTKFVAGNGGVQSAGVKSNNNSANCGALELDNVALIGPMGKAGIDLGSATDVSDGALTKFLLQTVHIEDVDNDDERGGGIYAEGTDIGSSGTISVHKVGPNDNSDALNFTSYGGKRPSGSLNELRYAGTSGLGKTEGISIGSAIAGGEAVNPDVPSKTEVGPRAASDSDSTSTSDEDLTGSIDTTYGGYATPEEGTLDWHIALNENFQTIEADVQDLASRIENLEN